MGLPETVPYLDWRWDDLVFLALAGVLLGGALLVVLARDIIRSGLWLVLSFAGLAGIYALLGSPFMAVAQVLVYMGAISVLILFAIMITQSKAGPARLVFQRQWWAGAIAAAVLVLLMLLAILLTTWPLAETEIIPQAARDIARLLFGENLFAFEAVGVLLLAAVIGGLYLARRDPDMPETNRAGGPGSDEESA
ncbi:MAG TPA: NADH-quinone oxidoreductase subunit J [Candidatus Limnocylindrales bacterium]|nr:NADH-quinone oxidoreductase subunit J [Candidatus Limnocylindrales bacterium]